MSQFPNDIIDKILRLSSNESYRSFCRMKLVSKYAINEAPFQLRFDSIGDFYTYNADKYTISQLRNPDSVEMVDFLSQYKIMVAEKIHLYPGIFGWMYKTILISYIGGNISPSSTLGSVREKIWKIGGKK